MASKFRRHIWAYLQAWIASTNRKPLILRGARQVGKTTVIREFGKRFTHFIELNAERIPDKNLIDACNDVHQFVDVLSLEYGISKITWNDTLLFIDEIQESPKAISMLRYIYEETPNLNVIAAGSLLEHSFRHIKSFPVGRINYLYLFPLNFQEYLEATGKEALLSRLQNIPIDAVAHRILLKSFHTYCIIGGMPEIVAQYVNGKDFTSLINIYQSIWDTYKNDVVKYASSLTEERVIKHIMNTAPLQVDKRVKFQNFGHSNYRSREVSEAFTSLDQAKIIQIIYPSTVVKPPIIPDTKKSPRIQFLDTGILNYELNIQADLLTMDDLSQAYKGAIIPHMITQELISLQSHSYKKPNFWVRDKTQASSEVDLIITFKDKLIPIEIKSGKAGKLRSLHQFMDRTNHPYAIRIYGGEFYIHDTRTQKGTEFHLMNIPYYLGTYIHKYIEYFVNTIK